MINFYTTYYANIDNVPKKSVIVPISRVVPDFVRERLDVVIVKDNFIAPHEDLLNDIKSGKINEKEYKDRYVKQICDYINGNYKFNDLSDWAKAVDNHYGYDYDNIVLVCYEGPGKFCHRHIFSKLLGLYGIECEELPCKKEDNINTLW